MKYHSCWATAFLVFAFCLRSQGATNYISIQDSAYYPNELAINVGDTVTWTQDDTTEHTVTSDDDLFNSDTLVPGDIYSLVFPDAGTFTYYCIFHGHGMSGVIVVAEAAEIGRAHV